MRHWTSIDDVKRANANGGWYWFSPGTMRFFRGELVTGIMHGCFFVSSEQFKPSRGPALRRKFTIRVVLPNGQVESVGGFQEYSRLADAKSALKENHDEWETMWGDKADKST